MFARKPKSTSESFEQYRNTYQYWGMQLRLDLAGMIISKMREEGMTQAEFADRANWSDSYVSRLIHADANCNFEVAARALFSLGIKPKLASVDGWESLIEATSEIGVDKNVIRDVSDTIFYYATIEGSAGQYPGLANRFFAADFVGGYDAIDDTEGIFISDVTVLRGVAG